MFKKMEVGKVTEDENGKNIGIQLIDENISEIKWLDSLNLGIYYANKFEYYLLK